MKTPPRHSLATDKVRYRRRAGGLRRRRDRGAGQGRGRGRRCSTSRRCRRSPTPARGGCSPARRRSMTRCRATSGARLPLRRRRSGGEGLRRGRACHAAATGQQPHRRLRRWSRARRSAPTTPRRDRCTLRVGCQGVFGLRGQHGRTCSKRHAGQGARADRQCRRLVRHEGLRSIPNTARCCYAAQDARPAGEVDRRALGELPVRPVTAATIERDAELALDKDGHFLAVRLTGYGNVGAYSIRRCRATGQRGEEPDRRLSRRR